jgi:prepilin signal peptidase PulO-like enzyme (type II secretory pathway)
VSLFSHVVSYALPDVDQRRGRLQAALSLAMPVAGAGFVAACLAVFGPTLHGFAASVFCLALAVVTATDLEYRLIPDRIVGPAVLVVLPAMTLDHPSPEWVLAGLSASVFLLLFSLISPQGMGMGDVKLAFLMGAALGRDVVVAFVVASVASMVPSIVLLALHGRKGRKIGFAFGPFLAFGSVVALFVGAAT